MPTKATDIANLPKGYLLMKALYDFIPIIIFFGVYKTVDIYAATAAAIVASLVQVAYSRIKNGHFENSQLIALGSIGILGGATLLLKDEIFIKWKPTVAYWILAVVFLGSRFIGKKTILQRMADSSIELPKKVWQQLNYSWVLFFMMMGLTNLYVIYHFDTDTWVNFKFFGTLALTLLFIVLQGLVMSKYLKVDNGK